MARPSTPVVLLGAASAAWLIAAPVLGHLYWREAPWVLVLLFAALAECALLALWLVASIWHDPVRRWDLPPNPADQPRGWRARLARLASIGNRPRRWLAQWRLRRPSKA